MVRQAGAVGTWGDMRKQEQLLSSLCLAAIAIVVAQPVRAEEKTLLQSPISTDLLTQQPLTTEAAEIIKVTGVRLKPTAQGLSIILETPTGRSLPA